MGLGTNLGHTNFNAGKLPWNCGIRISCIFSSAIQVSLSYAQSERVMNMNESPECLHLWAKMSIP